MDSFYYAEYGRGTESLEVLASSYIKKALQNGGRLLFSPVAYNDRLSGVL